MKKRLFHILTGRNSGSIAKKRLEFLLIADRAGCTPEILEMLKNDMIKVISRYMMIDPEQLEVKVIHMDHKGWERSSLSCTPTSRFVNC